MEWNSEKHKIIEPIDELIERVELLEKQVLEITSNLSTHFSEIVTLTKAIREIKRHDTVLS